MAKRGKDSGVLGLFDILKGVFSLGTRIFSMIKKVKDVSKITLDMETSMGVYIQEAAELYGDGIALLFEDRSYSYIELNSIANQYANHFLSIGIKKGDTVIVYLENRPEVLFIIIGLAKIGGIASLINPNLKGTVLEYSINLTPGNVLLVGEELMEPFQEIKSLLNTDSETKFYFLPDKAEEKMPEGFEDITEIVKTAETGNPAETAGLTLRDPFAFVFTSGTTGKPKAAIITHARWVSSLLGLGRLQMNLNTSDIIYISLPFTHATGLIVAWAPAVGGGAATVMARKFSVSRFWDDCRKYKATAFAYIGELCRYLMNPPEKATDKDNQIKKMIGNGLRPELWMEFKERFDIPMVYEFYGASEGNVVFTNLLNLDCTVGMSIGPYAIAKYDVELDEPIKDDDGHLIKVKKGESGLLLGKISDTSPFVGYTDEEATEKKILRNVFEKDDAWFDTGDLLRDIGFRHAQFVDRVGDTFRWKGENVSTTEVEEVVNTFNDVVESTVYGVTIEGTEGRAGMASIISKVPLEEFDFKGLTSSLKRWLPPYAVPIFLRFQDEFELTSTLKYKKTGLRKSGFDPGQVNDPLYVLIPGTDEYVVLTNDVYEEIVSGKYRF